MNGPGTTLPILTSHVVDSRTVAPVSRHLSAVTASAVRVPRYRRCVYCGWRATLRRLGVPTCREHYALPDNDPHYGGAA